MIKNDVARNNSTFKLDTMKTLVHQAVNKIPLENIRNTFQHARKIEDEYWKNDGLSIAPLQRQLIINLETPSSSSNSSSDEL